MATLYKRYYAEAGEFIAGNLNGGTFSQGANPNPPAWFEWVDNPYVGLTGFSFTAPATIGEDYSIYVDALIGGVVSTYVIEVSVITARLTLYDNCCDNQCNIAWLNREGGWQNYILTGVKEFSVDVGGAKTFINDNLELKYSEVEGVYNGRICSTGDIHKTHVDILDSLKYSVQAFFWNEETETWDIPILIDKKSFPKYKTRQKFFDEKIRFIFAEQVLIQSQ